MEEVDLSLNAHASAGETTCIAIYLSSNGIFGSSVGDSSALLVAEGQVVDLTANQHRKPMLGSAAAEPEGFDLEWLPGRLLVASDGLFNYAKRSDIVACVSSQAFEEVGTGLVDLARLPSSNLQDDISIIVCELGHKEATSFAT